MPSYDCSDCNESFDSREARRKHQEDVHGQGSSRNIVKSFMSLLTNKKKFSALIFGVIMVGLPLGGVMFYSSLGPDHSPSSPDDTSGYRQTPPVGYGITSVPRPNEIPQQIILREELTPDQQVYLLLRGGPEELQSGIRPAVLIQYSCTGCEDTRQDIESFVENFNNGESWVYVAPNTRMNQTIAATAWRSMESFDEVNQTELQQFICDRTANRPVTCIEDAF